MSWINVIIDVRYVNNGDLATIRLHVNLLQPVHA